MADKRAEYDEPTVLLKDEVGRLLPCFVQQVFELSQQEYLLLLPVDAPIELFAREEEDNEEVLLDVEESEIDTLFPTAKAVLSEQNLTLQRTAITLTAAGDIPEANEEDCLPLALAAWVPAAPAAPAAFPFFAPFSPPPPSFPLFPPLPPLLLPLRARARVQAEALVPARAPVPARPLRRLPLPPAPLPRRPHPRK
ncbi:DUF3727 domain-containing protein [filamentous cyanobacterium CCP5]|nr:DUF3727 domain-containing protein [filamentous cyanobacterium CCP5]